MKSSTLMVLALAVVALGIVLMIGGILTGKHGATVGGIIVSGVAAQSDVRMRKKRRNSGRDSESDREPG
jgi:uncharacterized protein GlcG (DUF336 family)